MPAHAVYLMEYRRNTYTMKSAIHTDAGLCAKCEEHGVRFPLDEFPLDANYDYVALHGKTPVRVMMMVERPEQALEWFKTFSDKRKDAIVRYTPFDQAEFDKYVEYAKRGFPALDDHRAWQAMLPNKYVSCVLYQRLATLVPETARPVITAVIKRLHEGRLTRTESMTCCKRILRQMSRVDKKALHELGELAMHGHIMASAMGITGA